MTFDEIKQIPELQIEVSPAVEDAFHFLYGLDIDNLTDAQAKCGERLRSYKEEERKKAIHLALKMIDNLKKYGVACAAWV